MLSGGMSRRFQLPGEPWIDKALYPIGEKPMISIVIERLSEVADEIIVAGGKRAKEYEQRLGVTAVEDADGLIGPLAGIYGGLLRCRSDTFIVLPNDVPFIEGRVLRDLARESSSYEIVSPILPNGVVETAMIAGSSRTAKWILSLLAGKGRAKVADLHRGSPSLLLIDARGRGYSPSSFLNVNKRENIGAQISYPEGPVSGDIKISREFGERDAAEGSERARGSLWGTLLRGWHIDEFQLYAREGAYMLAAYALMDSPHRGERELGKLIIGSLRGELI